MTNAGPNGDIDSIRLARHATGGHRIMFGSRADSGYMGAISDVVMDCELCGGSGHEAQMTCDFQERKSVSRAISPYLAGNISSLLVLLDTGSSSMSTFQNTEYMDARGSDFNNVGRDQINTQVIINPNSLGALQDHSCTVTCSFP